MAAGVQSTLWRDLRRRLLLRNNANDGKAIYLFQRRYFRKASVPRVAKRNRWAELFIHFVEKHTGIW